MPRLLRLLPMIALLLLCLLIFEKLAFSDMILARGDTYHYFYPYWDARSAAFRAGELPLWTPDIFMGAPLLADPQIGTFYPPNWLMTPFTAPDGIRYSILLHVFWACLGTFMLFRTLISPALMPAITAAALFALGGYLGAHVEQINQLQGLAWLPWLLYLLHRLLAGEKRFGAVLAIAWALQIFSGHTQTTFLSGVALGLYAVSYQLSAVSHQQKPFKAILTHLFLLFIAAIGAVLLAIPQLLPTLELIGMSNRGGGLTANQATAFSLPPWYLGRALLPSYDGQLFGEYIGYIGVIGLVLAGYGALSSAKDKRLWVWIGLALLGMFFAFGRANPVYVYLAELPLFNFFRVPARWMALYALAMAMLAGYGLLALQARVSWKRLALPIVLVFYLIAMATVSPIDATEITGSAEVTRANYIGWGLALGAFLFILILARYPRAARKPHEMKSDSIAQPLFETLIAIAVVVELFLASRVMPFNDLVPRDVYLGQRFTISQLLALNEGQIPPPRMLSISGRLFDVGDVSILQDRYTDMGMDEQAQATAFTALKSQEILFPNLGLTWGIPTIDGYGGGLLPTIYYSQLTSLILPEGSLRTVDGRLGEMMAWPDCRGACVRNIMQTMRLTNTRYLITDKVYDLWIDGVAYDTTFAAFPYGRLETDFVYTEIRILHTANLSGEFENHTQIIDENLRLSSIEAADYERFLDVLPSISMLAMSLVDTRTGDFQSVYPYHFQRILSSDIKIYYLETPEADLTGTDPYSTAARLSAESFNRAVLSDLLPSEHIFPDNWQGHEDALAFLAISQLGAPVLNGDAEPLETLPNVLATSSINFTEYQATRVSLTVNIDAEAYLMLKDAYYPGWIATVNGVESPIYRANVMFRAVRVPTGESTVVFEFVPRLWYGAMVFGGVVWLVALGMLAWLWRKTNDF